jgi:ferrochelatase
MSTKIGVLVMAYGGPDSMHDVEPYLMDVRGYRETSREIVDEVKCRYARIGGRSPIREQTEAQARAIQAELSAFSGEFEVAIGMRHWHPFIRETLADFASRGINRAVGVVMAPHYSRMSVGAYFDAVAKSQSGVEIASIDEWHLLPEYVDACAARVRAALSTLPAGEQASAPVIYSAHSLPSRILQSGDPYLNQLRATASAVAARLDGGNREYRVAFQSAAMTPEPWLGPDVGNELASIAASGGRAAVVAPIGFTCEHVEVLYDLDVVLQEKAKALGLSLARTKMIHDDCRVMGGLARRVVEAAERAGWR